MAQLRGAQDYGWRALRLRTTIRRGCGCS